MAVKRTTKASRKAVVIARVLDFDGDAWDARESRPTLHGFTLYIGWPEGCRGKGAGGPRIIPTPELVEFLRANVLRRDRFSYELPCSRTAVKRIKRLLALNYYDANDEWWKQRLDDLLTMTGVRFSALHGVTAEMVSLMHSRLIGRKIGEAGWWREESNAELLNSKLPRAYIAEKLDISVGAVGRLRWILKKEREAKHAD